ncbi:MAG: hypothetical protein HUJ25_06550 [Crocinitomicaceae bacterium]|nr:hypothetical protein [Crocinitomicaceae bacterium]
MTKTSLVILFIIFFQFVNGQNLIPNPGYEDTSGCPGATVFLQHTDHWFRLPNHDGSPDLYYGDCGYNGIINTMAPNQLPFEGKGYVGAFSFYGQYNQAEYLCVKLNSPMVKDSVYYIEFHVLPSPRYTNFHGSFGAHFSVDKPLGDGNGFHVQPFEEHIGNPIDKLIKDTINWTTISGFYKANGGEQYMILGNFRRTEEIPFESFDRFDYINKNSSYYFIDGVGVKKNDGAPFVWNVNQQPNGDHRDTLVQLPPLDDLPGEEREVKVIATIKTKKNKVKIEFWDHLRMDHDTVHIMLNDSLLLENFPIKKQKKKLKLDLPPGEYVLKVIAVNLGDIPPNTVSVRFVSGRNRKTLVLNSDMGVSEAIKVVVE